MTVHYMTGENMSKTPFGNKCNMLADIWVNFKDREDSTEGWTDMFKINDLGFPLAYLVDKGYVSVTKKENAKKLVEDTWEDMCFAFNIDKDELYESTIEMFRASEYYKDMDWAAIDAEDED